MLDQKKHIAEASLQTLKLKKNFSLTEKLAKRWQVAPLQFANWRWQMSQQITDAATAATYLKLSEEEKKGFSSTEAKFRIGITPYYLGLIAENPSLKSLRLQAIPQYAESFDEKGVADPLGEEAHSPVPEVVHVYPDRVAFCVAMLCPMYCRYCFRKRRDEKDGLHFNRDIIARGIDYIARNTAIKDVLITGGDPFIASDGSLEQLLTKLRAIKHVEVIRFGTRTPVTLPYRITKELVTMLGKFHPLWLNTHFNCVEEITPEAEKSLRLLADAGIPIGNQAVLLRGVNDSSEKMLALSQALIRNRVRPYYIFHAHMIAGTAHLRVPVNKGLEIIKSMRGKISGYAIPSYIVDTPSGKVPISPQHILGHEGRDLLLEDLHGEIWREKDAWQL